MLLVLVKGSVRIIHKLLDIKLGRAHKLIYTHADCDIVGL